MKRSKGPLERASKKPKTLNLFEAVSNNSVTETERCLNEGADVNAVKDDSLFTPLIVASVYGYVDVVRVLLNKGALVNKEATDGYTALQAACFKGHVEVVRVLLASGADVNQSRDGHTALTFACVHGHAEVVRLLLGVVGIKVNVRNQGRLTPLFCACQNGHVEVVRLLLSAEGIEVNIVTPKGTPLYRACENGHVEVVRVLLTADLDVNHARDNGQTPLYIASRNGNEEIVRALLTKGADVNKAKNDGETPLMIACWSGHLDVVRALLESGVDVNYQDNGDTALYMACLMNRAEVVRALLEYGANVNSQNHGETPLILVCNHSYPIKFEDNSPYQKSLKVVRALLEFGADVNYRQNNGVTALLLACARDNDEIVQELLNRNASFDYTFYTMYERILKDKLTQAQARRLGEEEATKPGRGFVRLRGTAQFEEFEEEITKVVPKEGEVCAICLNPIDTKPWVIRRCGHAFHTACLRQWGRVSNECPLCKMEGVELGLGPNVFTLFKKLRF